MGASPLMSLGMRAMAANYAALQVTGHNIANANVPGYSRQRVELATALGQFTGAGYFGKGSDVQTVTRAHNAFLAREVMTTQGLASKDEARLENLQRLESLLPLGEDGVGYATQEFLGAFSDLASLPADSSARQVVLARADELALRFSEAGAQMVELQTSLRQDLEATVAKVNELTSNIARLNGQIAAARGFGQPPNDLMDARDQLLSDLSKEIGITTVAADDGSIGVFAGGGQRLVLSNSAQQLTVVNDAGDPSRAALAVVNGSQIMRLEAGELGGGRIAGLLTFQNEDLVDAQVQLGQMAAAIGGAINAQQKLGLTLRPPVGSVPATDLFALGAPRALPMAGNATDSLGRPLGSVSLEITDPAQLQASEYELRASTARPGSFELTRLSDGESRLVQDGDEVDGLRITLGSPAPQPGDRFLLQPVTQAAASMRSLLTDPRDIAAASPLTANVSAANTGTMSIASLTITDASVDPQLSASIAFTDVNGNYAWALHDRVTNALVSSGIGHWEAGETLPAEPDSPINGFAITLSGRPAAGDSLNVSMTTNAATNNGNALALAALRDAVLVGRTLQPDGSLTGGATVTDAYAATLADVGVRVQGAESIAEISGALAAGAETARSSETGVNLDEEAAMLIQYQQSYQAAAKVLQIAQSVFDTLLNVAGG